MSRAAERGTRVDTLRAVQQRAMRLADNGGHMTGVEASAQAIALSLATLVGTNVDDIERDYNRDRQWREEFAAELWRLTGPEGATLKPSERNRRLRVLAQWLSEGYDGPPNEEVYAEGFEPRLP